MKTLKYFKLIVLILATSFAVSCVQDDDYDVPNIEDTPPVLEGTQITIGSLKQLLLQEQENNGNDFFTIEEELYTTGYVISNDEFGNFFEELILQDESVNPTTGIKILIDVNPLFIFYEFGRKTHIQLKGLTVGFDSGVFTIGERNGNSLDKISFAQLDDFIVRDVNVEEITPLLINISDFEADKTNLYIRLNDVQFNRNEVLGENRMTYAAEPDDTFDGERTLESCEEGLAVVFSTSTFSDFKAVLMPQGKGHLDGILTFNYYGDTFNIVVNSPQSINFDNEDRCDPEELVLGDPINCTNDNVTGSVLFFEDFETFDSIEEYVAAGWTNNNISETNTIWEIGSYSGNNYTQITGYDSGESGYDSWLITPEIDLDTTFEDVLNFEVQASYDNGEILTVLVSSNFTGNIFDAEWSVLEDVNIPQGPSGTFGDFEAAGPINTSCVEGAVHFAFRYQGSDPNATTRYHVDNIQITGN